MTADAGEPSDLVLLRQHADGDPNAFSILVTRHQDRLWAVALRTLGNPEEAADAVQDAMIKAFRSAQKFRGESAVTTWMHRIVVNACLDIMRRRKARPSVPLDDENDRLGVIADESAVDPAVQREQRMDVLNALQQLPEDQRAAIVLVDMEAYSVTEAAEILDCAPGTVKSRCSRGRARLAPLLGAWRNQSGPPDVRPNAPQSSQAASNPPPRPSAGPPPGGEIP